MQFKDDSCEHEMSKPCELGCLVSYAEKWSRVPTLPRTQQPTREVNFRITSVSRSLGLTQFSKHQVEERSSLLKVSKIKNSSRSLKSNIRNCFLYSYRRIASLGEGRHILQKYNAPCSCIKTDNQHQHILWVKMMHHEKSPLHIQLSLNLLQPQVSILT